MNFKVFFIKVMNEHWQVWLRQFDKPILANAHSSLCNFTQMKCHLHGID
jgi:hypothetical protein